MNLEPLQAGTRPLDTGQIETKPTNCVFAFQHAHSPDLTGIASSICINDTHTSYVLVDVYNLERLHFVKWDDW